VLGSELRSLEALRTFNQACSMHDCNPPGPIRRSNEICLGCFLRRLVVGTEQEVVGMLSGVG